jgi:hypothetical protein
LDPRNPLKPRNPRSSLVGQDWRTGLLPRVVARCLGRRLLAREAGAEGIKVGLVHVVIAVEVGILAAPARPPRRSAEARLQITEIGQVHVAVAVKVRQTDRTCTITG